MNKFTSNPTCQQCENYKFALTELRRNQAYRTLRYIAILVFVAALAIAFHSYIPCLFLLLLLL